MKKLLFTLMVLGSLNGYGQIFEQNFESSTDKTDYVGNGTGQFDWVSSFNNAPSTIETENSSNFLRFDKIGSSSGVIIRNTAFSNTSSVAVLKFKLRITGSNVTTAQSDILGFYLGDVTTSFPTTTFDENDTSVPAASNVFGSVNLRVVKSDASGKITYDSNKEVTGYQPNTNYIFVSATNSFYPAADWNELILIVNRTSSVLSYKGPNGTNYNLPAGKQAVYINTTQATAAGSLNANAELITFNKFKIRASSSFPNGTIDIDDISMYGDVSVLPVTFTSFTAQQSGNTAVLKWATASEQDNSRFEVLRSTGESDFKVIGTVKGLGTTAKESNYTFTDFNPGMGNNYYKIRQIDLDGEITEYPVTVRVFVKSNDYGLQVISNEGTGYITVNIDSEDSGIDDLSIADVNGRILYRKQIKLQSGQSSIQIPDNFRSGVYVLNLAVKKQTIKFVK